MELLAAIEKDIDNRDFSRILVYEHKVAVMAAQYRKAGANILPSLLEEALNKLKSASLQPPSE